VDGHVALDARFSLISVLSSGFAQDLQRTPMSSTAVFKIVPTTQKYDWGKSGLTSKVAQLISQPQFAGIFKVEIDERSPYAEVVLPVLNIF
jgi:hypothetical protein